MLRAMSERRRSQRIVLVLIGTVSLPACAPDTHGVVHDRYASLQECSADWGRPEVCDQDKDSRPLPSAFGGPRIAFRGPNYPVGYREEAQYEARRQALQLGALDMSGRGAANHAIEQAVPSRGGFGSSAHFFGRLG
jgi:uncharacterized protein YgiB involved in biofilm formation